MNSLALACVVVLFPCSSGAQEPTLAPPLPVQEVVTSWPTVTYSYYPMQSWCCSSCSRVYSYSPYYPSNAPSILSTPEKPSRRFGGDITNRDGRVRSNRVFMIGMFNINRNNEVIDDSTRDFRNIYSTGDMQQQLDLAQTNTSDGGGGRRRLFRRR